MKRPVGVTVVSVLAIVGGLLLVLSSIGYLGFPALQTTFFLGVVTGYDTALLMAIGIISLAMGVLSIALGIGMATLHRWAWLTGIAVWVSAIVLGIVQLLTSGFALVPVLTGILAAAILVYLSRPAVYNVFGVETPEGYSRHHPSPA